MGRRLLFITMILLVLVSSSGCASLLGGQKTQHQVERPECGEARRRLRPGFLVLDCLFPPFLLIDFATKKIYRPYPNDKKIKRCKEVNK